MNTRFSKKVKRPLVALGFTLAMMSINAPPCACAEESKGTSPSNAQEAEVSALKTELSGDWTSFSVMSYVECSCTGPIKFGFVVVKDSAGLSLVPWFENMEKIKKGKARALSPQEVANLSEVAVSHYRAALVSLDPMEKVGPLPKSGALWASWHEAYRAAGGGIAQDRLGIEITLKTAVGTRQYVSWYDRKDENRGFYKWLGKYDEGLEAL